MVGNVQNIFMKHDLTMYCWLFLQIQPCNLFEKTPLWVLQLNSFELNSSYCHFYTNSNTTSCRANEIEMHTKAPWASATAVMISVWAHTHTHTHFDTGVFG